MGNWIVIACAALGLPVGSFLNVVIWRVPRGESIVRPGSHCPSCAAPITARDNVPLVSWLVLGGRCRHCEVRISARYPAVELGTASLFGLLAWRFGPHVVLPGYLYLGAVGLALAVIDLDVHRLPNPLTLPSYMVGVALLGLAAFAEGKPVLIVNALAGLGALYAFYFILFVLYPHGMGFGDVKLAGVLGLYLGYLGWDVLAVGAFLGFLFGGLAGIALMVARRAGRKSMIPFGPFMVAGAIVAVFIGHGLAHAYAAVTLS